MSRPVWSESSLCVQWIAKDTSFLHVDSEDSDQTGRMPRLISIFAVRTAILLVLSCRGSHVEFNNASVYYSYYFKKLCGDSSVWKETSTSAVVNSNYWNVAWTSKLLSWHLQRHVPRVEPQRQEVCQDKKTNGQMEVILKRTEHALRYISTAFPFLQVVHNKDFGMKDRTGKQASWTYRLQVLFALSNNYEKIYVSKYGLMRNIFT